MTGPPFAKLDDQELANAIVRKIFEANLMSRAALLRGMAVRFDLVERQAVGYPKGYTEIQADVMGTRVP